MLELESVQADLQQLRNVKRRVERARCLFRDPRVSTHRHGFITTLLSIKASILQVQQKLRQIDDTTVAQQHGELLIQEIDFLRSTVPTMSLSEVDGAIDNLADRFSSFRGVLPLSRIELEVNARSVVQRLPKGARNEVQRDFEEIEKCYGALAYRAVLAFCGRILETALSRKYYQHQRRRHVSKSDIERAIGDKPLGVIIQECNRVGLTANIPGLQQQADLINRVRIFSIHLRGSGYEPDTNDARASVSFTIAALTKLYPHHS
jgi:hypothetical protein